MKTVMTIIGALTLAGGILLFIVALFTPIVSVSSTRISPPYAEATFYAILSIAAFVFSGVLLYASNISND